MSGHCKHCGWDRCLCDDRPSCHRCNGFLESDGTCQNIYCPNFTFKLPMNELFNLEPSESPKLKWMKRHFIEVTEIKEDHFTVTHGMKYICQADTFDAALFLAAKRLNLRLWNEETIKPNE